MVPVANQLCPQCKEPYVSLHISDCGIAIAPTLLVQHYGRVCVVTLPEKQWYACLTNASVDSMEKTPETTGTTPLFAICNLIIANPERFTKEASSADHDE